MAHAIPFIKNTFPSINNLFACLNIKKQPNLKGARRKITVFLLKTIISLSTSFPSFLKAKTTFAVYNILSYLSSFLLTFETHSIKMKLF